MRKALVLASMLALASPTAQAAPSGMIGWGCSLAGTAAVTAAVVINAQTLGSVVSGAAVAPLSPALLYGGLGAIMVSSVCALGYHVVPVFVSPSSPAPVPVFPATGGRRVAQLDP
ncbi:hypothetical protein [Azospirillum sp. TSO22-1]|uniref:hypothetical protein n=1 Tax=Azospirillum sp. TSO22-1 TaxID=716789 RepID=UPI0011B81065|nr:hypothetical protein [Azospirillum sp. TSO22-1]